MTIACVYHASLHCEILRPKGKQRTVYNDQLHAQCLLSNTCDHGALLSEVSPVGHAVTCHKEQFHNNQLRDPRCPPLSTTYSARRSALPCAGIACLKHRNNPQEPLFFSKTQSCITLIHFGSNCNCWKETGECHFKQHASCLCVQASATGQCELTSLNTAARRLPSYTSIVFNVSKSVPHARLRDKDRI